MLIRMSSQYTPSSLDEKSDRAYKKELKSDEKTKKRTDELDANSERLKQLIFDTKKDLQDQQRESENFDVRLEDLEKIGRASCRERV